MSDLILSAPLVGGLLALPDKGWFYTMFSVIRGRAIGIASASTALAMGIAALIVVLRMIRISYDAMSDEQQSGFGGIKLWDVFRPMLILLLIQGCTLWVGALDSVTNAVTMSVSGSVDAIGDKATIVRAVTADEQMKDSFSMKEVEAAKARASSDYQRKLAEIKARAPKWGEFVEWFDDLANVEEAQEKRAIRDYLSGVSEDPDKSGRAIRAAVNNYVNATKHTTQDDAGNYVIDIHDENIIPMICCWLYDNFYIVVQCIAEIILMILAMCSPWVLVISLLEPWKHAIVAFITAYVQVSFWKVVAAMINLATISFRKTAVTFAMREGAAQMQGAINGIVPPNTTGAAIVLSAIVSVAGLFCLLKVQDITAAIIPSASSVGSASGGGQTATGAAGAPVNITRSAISKIIGGISAMRGASAHGRRGQRKQADAIGESVAKHMKNK